MPPAVSVCMPVYNTAPYLAQAVESILRQDLADFELLIVNDGSTDGSLSVLEKLAVTDQRIRLVSRANKGLIATRNELLEMARGEFVAWADSDDVSRPARLSKSIAAFAADAELVCVGSAWQIIDPEGMPICEVSFPADHAAIVERMQTTDIALNFPTVMMRRAAATAVGGFREPFKIGEDYDLCLRLSERGHVANLPDVLVDYRQHLASTVNARRWQASGYSRLANTLAKERRETGSDRLQRGEVALPEFDPAPTAKQNSCEAWQRWTWQALGAGNVATARKYARLVLRHKPLEFWSWRLAYCAWRGH
jgi:glycosyltransferase involved in cell wall biosynthesis